MYLTAPGLTRLSQQICRHNTNFWRATNLLSVSGVAGWESSGTFLIRFDSIRCTQSSARLNEPSQEPTEKGPKTGVTPTFCLTGDDKALGQGHSTWAIVLSHKIALKCKFPLGPKGDLASALALLVWTNMWSGPICIMGRMEMRGQLCQPKTKRRKRKGRQTDAILLNCICKHKGVISWVSFDHFWLWSEVTLSTATLVVWQKALQEAAEWWIIKQRAGRWRECAPVHTCSSFVSC